MNKKYATRKHSLSRTSPKGGPFFGTCTLCGLRDLPASAVKEDCANPANLSPVDALSIALGIHADEVKQ